MKKPANSLPSDYAANRIQQAEKWGHVYLMTVTNISDTAEAIALVQSIAADLDNAKLGDIANTVAEINAEREANGKRCYRKVTEKQRFALATALLEKYGTPREIVKHGWSMTDAEIDAAE